VVGAAAAAPNTARPIVLADLADVTGAFALNGAEMHIGTDLAVAQINQAGGIHGHPLQVLYADPKSDPTFRLLPTGPQLIGPLSQYLVQNYGKRWAVMYSDYAFGQSQLRAYQAGPRHGSCSVPAARPCWALPAVPRRRDWRR
jgi:ABC-type branched-subunit amino acid transport system substrate-binding protein